MTSKDAKKAKCLKGLTIHGPVPKLLLLQEGDPTATLDEKRAIGSFGPEKPKQPKRRKTNARPKFAAAVAAGLIVRA
jgi:hypothetical protein